MITEINADFNSRSCRFYLTKKIAIFLVEIFTKKKLQFLLTAKNIKKIHKNAKTLEIVIAV